MNHTFGIAALAAVLFAGCALADESLAFSYAYRDDGGCPDPGHTVSGEYSRDVGAMDVSAYARTAPSGGDCRTDSLSYNVGVSRSFATFGGFDAVAAFGADKRSTSALYALADGSGAVMARADGGPYFPATLPAGAAETVTASLGLGRQLTDSLSVRLGANVVPVDWADHEDGRTLDLAAGLKLPDPFGFLGGEPGGVEFDLSVNAGAEVFGDAVLKWEKPIAGGLNVRASARYAFGLDALDDGAPGTQTVNGAPFVKLGAPQDDSLVFEVGVSFDLGPKSPAVSVNGFRLNPKPEGAVCGDTLASCYTTGADHWDAVDTMLAVVAVAGLWHWYDSNQDKSCREPTGDYTVDETYEDGVLVSHVKTPVYGRC